MKQLSLLIVSVAIFYSCTMKESPSNPQMEKKVAAFAPFALKADIDHLSANQKQLLVKLFEVADIMDDLFWLQSYGDKHALLDTIEDKATKKFVEINYGPWERLDDNRPFIAGVGEKPLGAMFYPSDMTKDEFEKCDDPNKKSAYTLLRRDQAGKLYSVPYSVAYGNALKRASALLLEAAVLADDEGFKKYLTLRAEALTTDNYQPSDMAWMEMKSNPIDFVVGPIENYEDRLFNFKTAFEAYILIKDKEWSERLNKFAVLLPELQKQLPVEDKYKQESPGADSELNAYDVVYYAGDCNAGSKTIAINLPNDEQVQLAKGSRRLQLKNAMQAKFDKILVPIANELIAPDLQRHIQFKAFFENTMYHEVAHGLGIKYVLNSNVSVSEALQDKYTVLEESKADILGLFLVGKLVEMNELEADLMDNYTTFLAGIFRSIRFGASSSHGVANLVRFNYFKEKGAFSKDENGQYSVNFEQMQQAIISLSNEILVIQGNGDYAAANAMVEKYGAIGDDLKADLDRINQKNIPVDIVFEKGPKVLGL